MSYLSDMVAEQTVTVVILTSICLFCHGFDDFASKRLGKVRTPQTVSEIRRQWSYPGILDTLTHLAKYRMTRYQWLRLGL